MVGNASEEGLLGQIGNPSHADPLRVVALASFVAGGLVYLLARRFIPLLTVTGGIVLGLATCIAVAWSLSRRIRARQSARRARELEAARAAHEADTKARIAAMKKDGEGAA